MKSLAALLALVVLATGACSFGGGSEEEAYSRDDCRPRDRGGHSLPPPRSLPNEVQLPL